MMFKAFLELTPAYSSVSFLLTSQYILVPHLLNYSQFQQYVSLSVASVLPALKWEASQFPQQPALTSDAEAPHTSHCSCILSNNSRSNLWEDRNWIFSTHC